MSATITAELQRQAEKTRELRPIVRPYLEGFADARGTGTRNGPVHLFGKPFNQPLCRRKVKRWNFEGQTDHDFCPKCVAVARDQHNTRNAGFDPDI